MDCRRIESLLPPYVDGEADPTDVETVDRHLGECPACRGAVAAQRTARAVLRARGRQIAPALPPGLRERVALTARRPASGLGWRGRVTAFAAAAVLFIALVSALELASPASNVLYAAQLAIDHVRCFVVEMATTAAADPGTLEQEYAAHYGWQVEVPPSNDAIGLRLIAARRCPFWLGDHAHLLYRAGDRELSLYIDRDTQRTGARLEVLGHTEHIWHAGSSTYALIARGVPEAELAAITAYLQAETGAR